MCNNSLKCFIHMHMHTMECYLATKTKKNVPYNDNMGSLSALC